MGVIYPAAQTLAEHWDGTAWTVVASPSPGRGVYQINSLNGIIHVSSNDVWAAGWYSDASSFADETLIEHWDGSAWQVVPSPNITTAAGSINVLNSVAALSSNDVWAVGSWSNSSNVSKTLTLRWDGSSWKIVASPSRNTNSYLNGVGVISPADAWAVGTSNTGGLIQVLVLFTPAA